jgi:hypothetical protein
MSQERPFLSEHSTQTGTIDTSQERHRCLSTHSKMNEFKNGEALNTSQEYLQLVYFMSECSQKIELERSARKDRLMMIGILHDHILMFNNETANDRSATLNRVNRSKPSLGFGVD